MKSKHKIVRMLNAHDFVNYSDLNIECLSFVVCVSQALIRSRELRVAITRIKA